MGVIYEAVRKLNNEIDDDDYNDEYDNIFIDFPNFLELLELYSSDDKLVIANYLHNHKEFLALDYYELDDDCKIVKTHYDDERADDHCPIEAFLDDVNGGRLSDYNSYYWDIKELLSLECIKFIDLDRETFDACYDAMFIEASTALQYKIENAKLKNQIDALNKIDRSETANDDNLTDELYRKIAELEKQLKQANANNSQADAPADDKELGPNSRAGVARMLYAILTENDYDLSPPMGKGLANDLIVNASQVHGTPVTKNFVAGWLKRANQAKINCTKK